MLWKALSEIVWPFGDYRVSKQTSLVAFTPLEAMQRFLRISKTPSNTLYWGGAHLWEHLANFTVIETGIHLSDLFGSKIIMCTQFVVPRVDGLKTVKGKQFCYCLFSFQSCLRHFQLLYSSGLGFI